jgi:hypothetical protein
MSSYAHEKSANALEPQVLDFPCTKVLMRALHSQELKPITAVDETARQPAFQPARSQTPATMNLTSHITASTETALEPNEPKEEEQQLESPTLPTIPASQSAESLSFACGPIKLHKQQQGYKPDPVDLQKEVFQSMKMDSQFILSEIDVRLYSDEEILHHNNTYNNNIATYNNSNSNEGYVNEDDISPIVSSQHSFSGQSSLFSATPDWPPANQEAARRLALLPERLLASSIPVSPSSPEYGRFQEYDPEIDHTPHSNDSMHNSGNNHNLVPNATVTGNAKCHTPMQEYDSLIRLKPNPKDTDTLSLIQESENAIGFGFDLGPGLGERGQSYGNASEEVMRGDSSAFGLDMDLFVDGASSEWIGSEEWEVLDNAYVDQHHYY